MGLETKLHHRKFDREKITIIPFGDNHFGSKYCDKELLKKHIDWIANKKDTFAIFMGDNVECATKDSIGAGVYEQEEIVHDQIEKWLDMVKPLAEKNKILGMHTGNHEWRIYKSSGLDITNTMAKRLKVKYFGWSVHHYFQVGKENYTLFSTHGSGGSRLPHTKIKAIIDRSNMSDVEIYLMGHLHQLSHHTRMFYRINKRKKIVEEGQKHYVLCGSYLDHWGSYAEQAGYEMMRKGSPKIKLSGLEHRIKISL